MTRRQLFERIRAKRSFLCVGLDTDADKLPLHLAKDMLDATDEDMHKRMAAAMFDFNTSIIDATAPYTVAYKPNLAFYEAFGWAGVRAYEYTCVYIRKNYPDIFLIADAKRGDIGNTSEMYARAFYHENLADAVTLSPYMGRDTVDPFLKYPDKWAIILALTSNRSADDFETLQLADGNPLWKEVLRKARTWGTPDNTMFVVGATRAETLKEVREIVPDHFLLVPGVGAQGGSLAEVAENGMNDLCGLLVNSSRGIIYASDGPDFAAAAAREAQKMAAEMATLLSRYL
jgi:orotidine-5'-phosphate decarboxylase